MQSPPRFMRQCASLQALRDPSMNKSELIDAIADTSGQTKTEIGKTLDALLETITATVAKGEPVALAGFGTFKATYRAAREGRNPATGATIQVPESTVPKFQPGATFKNRVAHKG
ncbi:HU family DNA-binding protein [Methylomagnum ishizawai]